MLRNAAKRGIYLLLAVLLLVPLTAQAAQKELDLSRTGSVRITLRDSYFPENKIGGTLEAFRVADARVEGGNLTFALTEDFAGSGVVLEDLNASGLAGSLGTYAEEKKLQGTAVQADANGVAAFRNLSAGLYLFTQSQAVEGYYPVAPFLVSIPMYSGEQSGWLYDIEAAPKVQRPSLEPVSLTVVKKWLDNNRNRPEELTVHLLKEGKKAETVVLTAKNGWKHTWTGLDAHYTWSVEEEVPSGYRAAYTTYGQTVTVTNTASWYAKPSDMLIQTGQLNWPVPVLACAGLIALLTGAILLRKGKRDE